MIKIKCQLGSFVIDKGQFVEGNKVLRSLYALAMKYRPPGPSNGPVDCAIAAAMMDSLSSGYEIMEEGYPVYEPPGVNQA